MQNLPRPIWRIIADFLPIDERCRNASNAVQTNQENSLFFLEMCGNVDYYKSIPAQNRFWACKRMIRFAKSGWQQHVRGVNFDDALFWVQHNFEKVHRHLAAEMHSIKQKMPDKHCTIFYIVSAITHWFFPSCSFQDTVFLQNRMLLILELDMVMIECPVPTCPCHNKSKNKKTNKKRFA